MQIEFKRCLDMKIQHTINSYENQTTQNHNHIHNQHKLQFKHSESNSKSKSNIKIQTQCAWQLWTRRWIELFQFRGNIVVSISACHAEDPGSIPGRGGFQALPRTWACNPACLVWSIVAPTAPLLLQLKSAVPNKIRSARIELANRSWQFAAIESPPCSVCTSCGLVLVHDSWFVCVGLSFVWCLAVFVLTNGEADLHSASCLRVLHFVWCLVVLGIVVHRLVVEMKSRATAPGLVPTS